MRNASDCNVGYDPDDLDARVSILWQHEQRHVPDSRVDPPEGLALTVWLAWHAHSGCVKPRCGMPTSWLVLLCAEH